MASKKKTTKKSSASDKKTLLAAIAEGDAAKVRRLLHATELANAVDGKGVSVLQHAIMASSWEPAMVKIVDRLIEMQAEVDHADKNGETPLLWAARFGRKKVAETLIKLGASVDTCDTVRGWNIVLNAAIHGHHGIVSLLIKHGADALAVGPCVNALSIAAEGGAAGLVERLITLGANVNQCDGEGASPLLLAVQNEHVKVVTLLLEHGADLSATFDDGQTVLHVAAEELQYDMAKLLTKRGAKIDAKDASGQTPLDRVPCADEDDEEEIAEVRRMQRLLRTKVSSKKATAKKTSAKRTAAKKTS